MRFKPVVIISMLAVAMWSCVVPAMAQPLPLEPSEPDMIAGDPVLPDFSVDQFDQSTTVDNPYFPLVPGTVYRYSAEVTDPDDGSTELVELEDFVTFETPTIAGINVRQVRAREFIDGLLVEDTLDWYAQDNQGNVWYLGEDSTAFEYDDNENLIETSKEGSWQAGVNGAQPGFIMPADPQVGFNYYQEFAPQDDALDQALVVALDDFVSVPAGEFDGVRRTLEFTELEPGAFEYKYYAPGVGLVLIEEDLDALGIPLNRIPLESVQVVPAPAAVFAGMMLLSGLGFTRTRRRRRSNSACGTE